MKKLMSFLFFLIICISTQSTVQATANYAAIYPPSLQTIYNVLFFDGDRHGDFEGDLLVVLEDGSSWKIHPNDKTLVSNWNIGDTVRVKVRTTFYWFKREHKFELYNHSRGQSAKVMIIGHKYNPVPLTIVSTDTYAKSEGFRAVTRSVPKRQPDGSLKYENRTEWVYEKWNFRKILSLSDGSFWVIKKHLDDFQLGNTVYIGAQGLSNDVHYDFVLIKGNEREAIWTWARNQY